MNIRRIIAVVITAAIAVSASAADSTNKETGNKKKGKVQLLKNTRTQKENRQLKAEIDSLRTELERYRMELEYADSLNNEMMGIYEGNEADTSSGINPEDYTAEISDSLLNIWYVHNRVNEEDITDYDMDSVRFQSNVPDEVYLERI